MLQLGSHVLAMPDLVELPSNCDIFAVNYYNGSGGYFPPYDHWRLYLKHIRPTKRNSSRMTIATGDSPRPPHPFTVKVPRFWLPEGWQDSVLRANKFASLCASIEKYRIK